MKIIINALNFYPEIVGNGKYSSELAFWLAKRGEKVIVLTTNPYYPKWKCVSNNYKKQIIKNVTIYRCPVFIPKKINGLNKIIHYLSFLFFSFPISIYLSCFKPDLSITICPTIFSIPSMISLGFISKIVHQKKVYSLLHYQDLEIEAAFNLNIIKGKFLKNLILFFEKKIINNFSFISTISFSMMQKIRLKLKKDKELILLPNFINTEHYQLKKENPYWNSLGLKKGTKIIMYSGTINEKLSCKTLINTIRLLKDEPEIFWIISGEGPLKKSLIGELKDFKNVKITSFQPSDKLAEWINIASIHLIPQKMTVSNLVLPSKLLAILSSSKPVVGFAPKDSDLGKILEIAGVRIPKEDSKLLAEAIIKLINNEKLRRELGLNGNKYVKEFHEKEKVLSEFFNKLKKIINS